MLKRTCLWLMVVLLLAACSSPDPETVRETVVSEIPVTVEVTRPVEVTRLVEATVEVEVTRLVEVMVTVTPSPSPEASPTAEAAEFQKYTSQDAIDAFIAAGLEAESPEPVDPNDQSPLPKTFVEAQRFFIPSLGEDRGGRVFSFANQRELDIVRDYYEAFTGALASWVFVKDNLIVQIAADYPREQALLYETVLGSLE